MKLMCCIVPRFKHQQPNYFDSRWHSGGTLRRRHLLDSLPLPRYQQRCPSRSQVYEVKWADTTGLGTRGEGYERIDHQSGTTSALVSCCLCCLQLIHVYFVNPGNQEQSCGWYWSIICVTWQMIMMVDCHAVANGPRTPKGCAALCVWLSSRPLSIRAV